MHRELITSMSDLSTSPPFNSPDFSLEIVLDSFLSRFRHSVASLSCVIECCIKLAMISITVKNTCPQLQSFLFKHLY